MNSVGIALGSNVGDRRQYLTQAIQELQARCALSLLKASPVYESAALLPAEAKEGWDKPYLNQVVIAQTPAPMQPLQWLAQVKHIEQLLGRQDRGHWGPREIDIDLLFLDDNCLRTPSLTLPHALMQERAFVMVPLADIAPSWVHPLLGRTAAEIAATLSQDGLKRYAD